MKARTFDRKSSPSSLRHLDATKDNEKQAPVEDFETAITHVAPNVSVTSPTDPDLKIVTVNQAACELLEYRELELIGRPVQTLFKQEPYTLAPPIDTLLRNSTTRDNELTYVTATGRHIAALVSASTLSLISVEAWQKVAMMLWHNSVRKAPTSIRCRSPCS